MKPPTLPANYAPLVNKDELVRALELIRHATAPTHNDGAHHEAAHALADNILCKVEARRKYEDTHQPI